MPHSLSTPNSDAARLIPEAVSRVFGMLAYSLTPDGVLHVAIADTGNQLALQAAQETSQHRVELVAHDGQAISEAIELVYAPAAEHAASGVPVRQAPEPAVGQARRLGGLLIAMGLIDEDELSRALLQQERTGSRLGDTLVAEGIISEQQLIDALGEHFQMRPVDLTGFEPEPGVAELLPENVAHGLRAIPVAQDDSTIYVAVHEVLDDESHDRLKNSLQADGRRISTLLASRNAIEELLQKVYHEQYTHEARMALRENSPENSAHEVLTTGQKAFFILTALIIVACLIQATTTTLIVLIGLASFYYLSVSLYKVKLIFASLGHHYETQVTPEEIAALDERTLPVYTILLPLYKEASIVHRLVDGLGQLDYPKTKLDIKLLCEADDVETIQALRDLHLPSHYKIVIVPDSLPKTKPKACNYGLKQADGKYIVIFDGEDRPDPDQLKKAVIAFSKANPRVTCIQAKLNYFNQDQNLLTKWFACEYSMHFDLVLPGLDAAGVPIPLGGTSNHFVTERLRELGAWDPYNVTEDADLGVRLHKAGYQTAMMDSTTLEEANSQPGNWIRQRSRWIKGYIQTWLVHMRNPVRLLREIGLKDFIAFNLVVGGVFVFLLNPIFWVLTTFFALTQAGFIQELFPGFVFYAAATMLFIGNFIFVYLNVAGTLQRGYFGLTKYALLSPLYWGMMSWAAWKGFIQLIRNPHYWEKTEHGLDLPAAPPTAARSNGGASS